MKIFRKFILFILALGAVFFLWGVYVWYVPLSSSIDVVALQIDDKKPDTLLYALDKSGQKIPFFIRWYISYKDLSQIVVGTHYIQKNISLRNLFILLEKESVVAVDKKVTLPEGWDIHQMAEYFSEKKVFSQEAFFQEVSDTKKWKQRYSFLSKIPDGGNLEGFLFPDTYRILDKWSAEAMVDRMLKNFKTRLIDTKILDPDASNFYDVVIRASLLEAEVQNKNDMALVSGLINNRLSIGMALQFDSTINYITRGEKDRLSLEETKHFTPYNTYQNKGLPPGPIGNPGLYSIEAALHPIDNDYLFFLTDSNGKVYYAKDFEEHKKNKGLYLR